MRLGHQSAAPHHLHLGEHGALLLAGRRDENAHVAGLSIAAFAERGRRLSPSGSVVGELQLKPLRLFQPMQADVADLCGCSKVDGSPFVAVGERHPCARETARRQPVFDLTAGERNGILGERPVGGTFHLQFHAKAAERHGLAKRQLHIDTPRGQHVVVAVVLVRVGVHHAPRPLAQQLRALVACHLLPASAVGRGHDADAVALSGFALAVGHRSYEMDGVGPDGHAMPRILQPRVVAHDDAARPVVAVDGALTLSLRQLAVGRGHLQTDGHGPRLFDDAVGEQLGRHVEVERRRLAGHPAASHIAQLATCGQLRPEVLLGRARVDADAPRGLLGYGGKRAYQANQKENRPCQGMDFYIRNGVHILLVL